MRNRKPQKVYCNGCNRWLTSLYHRNCPLGATGSLLWVDIENFQAGCNKCNQIWTLEEQVTYCHCGHVQKTEYLDSEVVLKVGDEVIATEGNIVYVLRESGELTVGCRSYLNFGYVG